MPVNIDTTLDIQAVTRMHNAVVDFGRLVQTISDNNGADYSALITLPARVANLLAQKANFDAIGLSAARIAEITEKNLGYTDWSANVTDFSAVFTKAATFRDAVVANIAQFTPSYVSNALTWADAPANVQTAITTNCTSILSHFE